MFRGGIIIKIKFINIFIFILVFISAAGIVNGADANISENSIYFLKEINEYKSSINNMKYLVAIMEDELHSEINKIEQSENPEYIEDVIDINAQIEKLKFRNGYTPVWGPGIMLKVSDNTNDDPSLDVMDRIVHDVDITVLLNDLKSAGAEAIDVNGERIINISEVVCAGPLLRINGKSLPAPFVIKAIGDPEKLYEAIDEEGTYAYELKNILGMEVEAIMSYYLTIDKYDGTEFKAQYADSID